MKTLLFTMGLSVLLFSSCATILHQRTCEVQLSSSPDSMKVYASNPEDYTLTPATVVLERSTNDVMLTVEHDSLSTSIHLVSTLSPTFWALNYFTLLVGYAIDKENEKRFSYLPRSHYLIYDPVSQRIRRQNWIPNEKGQLNLRLSIPLASHFYINRGEGYGIRYGFGRGMSAGVEHYYADDKCISMNAGLFGYTAPLSYTVEPEINDEFYSRYIGLQLGGDIKRFHFDYGLQLNGTDYYEYSDSASYWENPVYSDHQVNLGLALSAHYRLSNGFSLGLNYYPSAFTWNRNEFELEYAHIFWFELIFRIEVKKPSTERAAIWVAR
ncbi:hypothetical protein ACFL5M_06220 [Candidatus Neomarinimicrobiota bacterium]